MVDTEINAPNAVNAKCNKYVFRGLFYSTDRVAAQVI